MYLEQGENEKALFFFNSAFTVSDNSSNLRKINTYRARVQLKLGGYDRVHKQVEASFKESSEKEVSNYVIIIAYI